ncbi:MAG: hypothetical protein EA423_07845 [Phycisphaerales bacterium]|nr:MAG: hypothetical protein EA423_07845 [Phycisphaerales bacterium]
MSEAPHLSFRPAEPDETPLTPTAPIGRIEEPDDGEYDALADLFLGDRPKTRAVTPPMPAMTARGPSARARLEAVVLGNLPVLAGAWLRQYADARARACGGPAALVRCQPGSVSVELVGPGAAGVDARADGLEDALRIAAGCDAVVLRLEETQAASAPAMERLDAVTLLTGADDAALVSGYRTLKGLAGVLGESATGLRVAWMGVNDERASAASARLSGACGTFLGRELETSAVCPRVDAVEAVTLYRGSQEIDTERLLSILSERPAPRQSGQPAQTARLAGDAEAESASTQEPARAEVKLARRAPDPFVLLDGIERLRFSCPDAPGVALGADSEGRLVLVAEAMGDQSIGESVRALSAASVWSVKQSALIRLASSRVTALDAASPPRRVLMTDRPREARPLLDGEVSVYLLSPARPAADSSWACVEL